jgi:serine protease Do
MLGLGCLAAGIFAGQLVRPRAPAPVWRDAPIERSPGVLPSFAPVVAVVRPGVVAVRARLAAAAPRGRAMDAAAVRSLADEQPAARSGSGFAIDPRGLVVTSRHVVVDAAAIDVVLPDRGTFAAELVGEDRATDLALLRLVRAPSDLTVLPLGHSSSLQAGDWIVAVGCPFGFAETVTPGVVSFVGRHLPHSDFGVTNDFLQISAAVNPGSSGCPVVDLQGRVVGVTTQAPVDAQGISFAVPADTLRWTLAAMQSAPDGRVRRGYLGIEFASRALANRDARSPGAVVVHVVEGQPAHRAGVRAGDVVLGVDGKVISDALELHQRIVSSPPGTPIALQLLRDGMLQDPVVAVLGEVGTRPQHPAN